MKDIKTKDIAFKFTLADDGDDKGAFTGYASIFGAIDSYGDMVMPGAFKRTLKNKGQFPILWSHDVTRPIGVISGREDDKGLIVDGQLNMDVAQAREVRSLMKQGAVSGLSIGYQTVKEGVDKETGARQLKEINLWEISACVFQACPDAVVGAVKSQDQDPDPGEPTPTDTSNPEMLHLLDKLRISI